MASRFWVGSTGSWDGVDTTHWSATSGGAGGASAPGASDDVTFDANSGGGTVTVTATQSVNSWTSGAHTGTINGNGQTITVAGLMSITGTATRSVNLTNCAITCGTWTASTTSGLTLTATGSTITQNGLNTTFTGGNGLAYGSIVLSGAGLQTVTSAFTCVNFTRTGTATKTDSLGVASNFTVTGVVTWAGNTVQGVNRLLVSSNTRGTQRTITCTGAAVVISGDVDFMDIAHSGSPSWANAGSSFVGDCGGNGSLVTTNRTTPATQTHTSSAGGSWSDVTKWTSRVPLPQDNVVVDVNTTGTLTNDMPRLGTDLTFTGFLGTFTNTTASENYGSIVLGAGMSLTGTQNWAWAGRSTHTITSNTRTFSNALQVNGPGGTYTLQDDLICSRVSASAITNTAGTLVDNGKTVTLTSSTAGFSQASSSATTTLTGTWNIANTATGNFWSVTAGTVNASTVTINLTVASANTRTFAGGGKTYGSLNYTVASSSGALVITGANTFGTLQVTNNTTGKTLTLPSATTTTITTALILTGNTANISLNSSTGASAATISAGAGVTITVDHVTMQDSTATGGALFRATHATNTSNNTGWLFYVGAANQGALMLTGVG